MINRSKKGGVFTDKWKICSIKMMLEKRKIWLILVNDLPDLYRGIAEGALLRQAGKRDVERGKWRR